MGVVPFLSALLFYGFPGQIHNGWLLIFLLLLEQLVRKLGIVLFSLWPYVTARGQGRFFV
jgi:hypothetical protein